MVCLSSHAHMHRVFRLTPDLIDGKKPLPLKFVGGWLLTSPEEDMSQQVEDYSPGIDPEPPSIHTGIQVRGRTHTLTHPPTLHAHRHSGEGAYTHTHTPTHTHTAEHWTNP